MTGTSTSVQTVGTTYGVDTHKDVNVAFALDRLGRRLDERSVPTTEAGSRDLFQWAQQLGQDRVWGIEGTGSYGAGLTRFLRAHGETVFEVSRPYRRVRRDRGKSDPIDAEVAARNVLAGQVQGPTTRRLRSRFCSSRVVPAIDAAVEEPGGRGGSFERDDGFDQDETGVVRGDRPAIAWFTDPAGATPWQCRSMTHGRRMAPARSRLFRAGNWRADPNGG